jgi:hypothetical protein
LSANLAEIDAIEDLTPHLKVLMNEELLRENEARWHKSCRTKVYKLKDAKKKAATSASFQASADKPFTHSSMPSVCETDEPLCFFCDQPAKKKGPPLKNASTMELDCSVRELAKDVGDIKILKKTSCWRFSSH